MVISRFWRFRIRWTTWCTLWHPKCYTQFCSQRWSGSCNRWHSYHGRSWGSRQIGGEACGGGHCVFWRTRFRWQGSNLIFSFTSLLRRNLSFQCRCSTYSRASRHSAWRCTDGEWFRQFDGQSGWGQPYSSFSLMRDDGFNTTCYDRQEACTRIAVEDRCREVNFYKR